MASARIAGSLARRSCRVALPAATSTPAAAMQSATATSSLRAASRAGGYGSTVQCASASRCFSTSRRSLEKKYTSDHEWIDLSDDKQHGTIGVSTYAAKNLGDVVFVELPEVDADVSAGDAIGAVESVKSASDILTPVAGKVVAVNEVLQEKPGTINKGPETEGWIAKIELNEQGRDDFGGLMDAEAYSKFVEE